MTDEAMSPLRRRMIEDMTIRKLAPKTQHDYVQRVKNFVVFLGRSPDTASFEDVRRYQLHLVASGVGVPTINQTVSTLRFFFRVTLKRHEIVEHTHVVHEPRKLPVVLSPEEVARLLDAARSRQARHHRALYPPLRLLIIFASSAATSSGTACPRNGEKFSNGIAATCKA
jgi:integrase/recombinase XerD